MEYKVEAHRIMSISLGKIYNSRVQRGGSNCTRTYWSRWSSGAPGRYTSATTTAAPAWAPSAPKRGVGRGETMESLEGRSSPGAAGADSCESETESRETLRAPETNAQASVEVAAERNAEEPASSSDYNWPQGGETDEERAPGQAEDSTQVPSCPVPESRFECGAANADEGPQSPAAAAPCCTRKRSAGKSPYAGSPVKRPRPGSVPPANTEGGDASEDMDTGNVSSLITIFGSSFSGLLSKDGAQAEPGAADGDSGSGTICCEQMLPNLSPWSTAIVAFKTLIFDWTLEVVKVLRTSMDGGRLTSRKDKLPPLLAALNHVENRGRVQYGASPPSGHMATPTCAGCLSGHVPIGAGEEGGGTTLL